MGAESGRREALLTLGGLWATMRGVPAYTGCSGTSLPIALEQPPTGQPRVLAQVWECRRPAAGPPVTRGPQ